MANVLCLDTEPETVAALSYAGHHVVAAPFGYRNGGRYLADAPHDFDLILCDLKNPACFDMNRWGPYGGNDNFSVLDCSINQVTWEERHIVRGAGSAASVENPGFA